jgi:dTDP-4-dehydrorhamnose reductase
MRILITGADGRLGRALVQRLTPQHEVIPTDQPQLDFTNFQATRAFFHDKRPDMVLHCGALTAVDYCAEHPAEALRVNGLGTKYLALASQAVGASLLYVSSNEVFDGRNTGSIGEYDAPAPINPYGYSKWVGEQAVRQHLTRFYIVRTSWLFAHGGRNFIHAILDRAQSGAPLRVVVNEVAAPTYNEDLADAICALITTDCYGIYHLVNAGRASRWAFARQILDFLGHDQRPIEKISAAQYPRSSTPPEYAVLANHAGTALGITLRPWQEALRAFLQREGLLS